jgi:transcriptional regulator with XRE-family HTH domain/Zn-dependent peptidase ImmA (M78 family)
MEKKLNTQVVTSRMLELGLSQTDLAERLDVSKTAISSWLKPEKFPRPLHLLKLSEILKLRFDEIVSQVTANEPVVAFRKSGNHKITDEHREHFQYISRLLQRLVPHLPFDSLSTPPVLKNPKVDYDYVQKAAQAVRGEIGKTGVIDFEDLLSIFGRLQAVIIPVLWGPKHYKQATHVYLPESSTTWIFVNLDTKVFDFKFWLAHELGHAKAPQLLEQEGEDFADAFAGALLFPEEEAGKAYQRLKDISDGWKRFNAVCDIAKEFAISPITIYLQIEAYAKHHSLDSLDLESYVYKGSTEFNKRYKLLSHLLFGTDQPDAATYLKFAKEKTRTCFFECLAAYLKTEQAPAKFVANVLDVSLEDAHSLYRELVG